MTGLLAAAMAAREAERVANLDAIARWRGAQLCTECFKLLPKQTGAGRPLKRHQTPECRAAYVHRTRCGWRKPKAHKAIQPAPTVNPELAAARAEYRAATLAAAAARRKLKALVKRGREIPNEG